MQGGMLRVLVVEDNALNQKVVATLLQPFGAKLTFIADGEEAVTIATSATFDLVLMDIQLPGMSGLDAIRAIRSIEAGLGKRRTPIICLTAQAASKDKERARTAGADAHLAKPIDLGELLATIEAVLPPGRAHAA